jgi:hypothetical protein
MSAAAQNRYEASKPLLLPNRPIHRSEDQNFDNVELAQEKWMASGHDFWEAVSANARSVVSANARSVPSSQSEQCKMTLSTKVTLGLIPLGVNAHLIGVEVEASEPRVYN